MELSRIAMFIGGLAQLNDGFKRFLTKTVEKAQINQICDHTRKSCDHKSSGSNHFIRVLEK